MYSYIEIVEKLIGWQLLHHLSIIFYERSEDKNATVMHVQGVLFVTKLLVDNAIYGVVRSRESDLQL